MHWIHHVMFDPLSVWEKMKVDFVVFVIAVICILLLGAFVTIGEHGRH